MDLFAGCGGLTEGFQQAGFQPLFAVEANQHAAATYRANFGDHVKAAPIQDILSSDFPKAAALVGGPPCQGFSGLGRQDPSDPRNQLWKEFERAVLAVEPYVFVLENVPQFLKSSQFRLLQQSATTGPLKEYGLTVGLVNAADYGVAQRRIRAIVIGSRVGPAELPLPTHQGPDKWIGLAEVLKDIPFDAGPSSLPDRTDSERIPGPFKAHEIHIGRNPQAQSIERYNHVPPGGNRFDLPDRLKPPCWLNKPTGTTDVMGRLEWDKPALTIRTEFFKPEKGRSLHPEWDASRPEHRVNRPITHWEAARIQSFPDDFAWCGTKLEIARQIGNAVPPTLAEALAKSLLMQGLFAQ